MKGSFFQSNSIKFTVETPNIKKKVGRKFQDFEWFKKKLEILFPFTAVRIFNLI